LYEVDVGEALPDRCHVEAWTPGVPGIAEVFHAHIVDYAYPIHCHDTWTVLIVDSGAIAYDLDRRHCGAAGLGVTILPPGVAHDGKPAPGGGGFQKRNLYLAPSFLPGTLTGPAVDHTNIDDPQLRQAIAGVHESLVSREDSLDIEARLELIAERIAAHLGTDPPTRAARERRLALALRALLDEHTTDPLTLADAAARLERSPAHLLRTFTLEFGISPHAYVIGRRVEAARRKLLEGVPVAEVAVAVGFYDQAHLTRHFKRHTSVTPARFASSHVLAPTRSAGGDSRERDAVGPRFRSVSH
jgi:AraC-like DNA-binding protein